METFAELNLNPSLMQSITRMHFKIPTPIQTQAIPPALLGKDILGTFHLIIGLFGMYRITKRTYEDNPESTFTPLPRNITPLGIELDPATGVDLSSTDKK